jgi:hypothetical protein
MWNHAVKFAGQIDQAMNVGRRVYGALQPAIQDMGGSNLNKSIMSGITRYDKGRSDIMGQHNQIQSHLSNLRRAAPELDL